MKRKLGVPVEVAPPADDLLSHALDEAADRCGLDNDPLPIGWMGPSYTSLHHRRNPEAW